SKDAINEGRGDQFWPTYWLCENSGFEKIKGVSWNQAFNDFIASHDGLWLFDFIVLEVIPAAVIMAGAHAYASAQLVTDGISDIRVKLLTFAITMLCFMVYHLLTTDIRQQAMQVYRDKMRDANNIRRDPEPDGEVTYLGQTFEKEDWRASGFVRPAGWFTIDVSDGRGHQPTNIPLSVPVLVGTDYGSAPNRHRAHDWYMNEILPDAEGDLDTGTGGKLSRIVPIVNELGEVSMAAVAKSPWIPRFTDFNDEPPAWDIDPKNYTVSPAYKVHYQLSCYFSQYSALYKKGAKWDPRIIACRIGEEFISAALSFVLSMALSSAICQKDPVTGHYPKTSWWENFQLTWTRSGGGAGLVQSAIDESLIEGSMTMFFTEVCHLPEVFADQLSEALSFGVVDDLESGAFIGEAITYIRARHEIRMRVNSEISVITDITDMYYHEFGTEMLEEDVQQHLSAIEELHMARIMLVTAKQVSALASLDSLYFAHELKGLSMLPQIWPQHLGNIATRMVHFPNIDARNDYRTSAMMNQALKTRLVAYATEFPDVDMTLEDFIDLADTRSACWLNPEATLKLDASWDDGRVQHIESWARIKNMLVTEFLATHQGYTFTFTDDDASTNTAPPKCPRSGGWWTYFGAPFYAWLPLEAVHQFAAMYDSDGIHDAAGNEISEWVCPICGRTFTDYKSADNHVGGVNVRVFEDGTASINKRLNNLEKRGSPEVLKDYNAFANKLGVTESNNPILYATLTHMQKLPWDVFHMTRAQIADKLRSDNRFKNMFTKWLKQAYGEGQLYNRLATGSELGLFCDVLDARNLEVVWNFPAKGLKHFDQFDCIVLKRTPIKDASGRVIDWDYDFAMPWDSKISKNPQKPELYKTFLHDLVSSLRKTKRVDGIGVIIAKGYNIETFLADMEKCRRVIHEYYREPIEIDGIDWNVAELNDGTIVHFRFKPDEQSDLDPFYGTQNIPMRYTVAYKISKDGKVEFEGTTSYRYVRLEQFNSEIDKFIEDFITSVTSSQDVNLPSPP
nr:hypothetical protein [Candidatus Sigynarchaeota archaeon]